MQRIYTEIEANASRTLERAARGAAGRHLKFPASVSRPSLAAMQNPASVFTRSVGVHTYRGARGAHQATRTGQLQWMHTSLGRCPA